MKKNWEYIHLYIYSQHSCHITMNVSNLTTKNSRVASIATNRQSLLRCFVGSFKLARSRGLSNTGEHLKSFFKSKILVFLIWKKFVSKISLKIHVTQPFQKITVNLLFNHLCSPWRRYRGTWTIWRWPQSVNAFINIP